MTPKEQLFCSFFDQLRNPKQAAIHAGYLSVGAQATAARLLLRNDIKGRIKHLEEQRQHQNLKQEVVAGLRRLAFGSVADAIKLVVCDEMSKNIDFETLELFGISEIKRARDGALEMKFFDRLKAMSSLLDLAGLQDGNQSLTALYRALQQPAENLSLESGEVDGSD